MRFRKSHGHDIHVENEHFDRQSLFQDQLRNSELREKEGRKGVVVDVESWELRCQSVHLFIFTVVDWTMVRGLSMSMLWNSCECVKELTLW